jgi:hypothetical protein
VSRTFVECIVIPTGAERSERSGGTCCFSQIDLRRYISIFHVFLGQQLKWRWKERQGELHEDGGSDRRHRAGVHHQILPLLVAAIALKGGSSYPPIIINSINLKAWLICSKPITWPA